MVYFKLLLTAVFWGGTFIAGRMVVADVEPHCAAFLRFFFASGFLLLLLWRRERHLPPVAAHQIVPLLLLGMTGIFCYNVFFFKGLKLIGAGRAAIIIATNPVFIALVSAALYKEKLTPLKTAGILMSVSGAVIAVSRGDLAGIVRGGVGPGDGFIFVCVLSWVTYSIIGKKVLAGLTPLATVAYASLIGTLALFIPAVSAGLLHELPHYAMSNYAGILYLSIFGTVLGFVWYYEGVRALGPTRAGLFINFVPLSAIILAFLILHEPLTPSLLIGAVLVTGGVGLTNLVALSRAVNGRQAREAGPETGGC